MCIDLDLLGDDIPTLINGLLDIAESLENHGVSLTSMTRSQVAACVPSVSVGINRTMQMVFIVTGTKRQSFNLTQFKVWTNGQIVNRTHNIGGD